MLVVGQEFRNPDRSRRVRGSDRAGEAKAEREHSQEKRDSILTRQHCVREFCRKPRTFATFTSDKGLKPPFDGSCRPRTAEAPEALTGGDPAYGTVAKVLKRPRPGGR